MPREPRGSSRGRWAQRRTGVGPRLPVPPGAPDLHCKFGRLQTSMLDRPAPAYQDALLGAREAWFCCWLQCLVSQCAVFLNTHHKERSGPAI